MKTQKRRRKENKTDYKARLSLLKSGMPRIVVRKSNRYIYIQAVESEEAKDKVISGISSRELLKHGWNKKYKGSLKSIPATYLTGLLFSKLLENFKTKEFILDSGMLRNIPGNRIYSVIKGLVDGGVKVRINEKVFPNEKRLEGEHLRKELKNSIEKVMLNLKKKTK